MMSLAASCQMRLGNISPACSLWAVYQLSEAIWHKSDTIIHLPFTKMWCHNSFMLRLLFISLTTYFDSQSAVETITCVTGGCCVLSWLQCCIPASLCWVGHFQLSVHVCVANGFASLVSPVGAWCTHRSLSAAISQMWSPTNSVLKATPLRCSLCS